MKSKQVSQFTPDKVLAWFLLPLILSPVLLQERLCDMKLSCCVTLLAHVSNSVYCFQ